MGGIMVLGHDFHSEEGYRKSLLARHESMSQPTWRNLMKLFDEVPIDASRCFFTNVYVGLRAGKDTTGPFPGSSDPAFVKHCEVFLLSQLEVMRPAVIITLGINVPPFLSRLATGLADWGTGMGLKYLDDVGPVREDVEFAGDPPFKSTVVALSHPSLRHSNLRHRHYRNQTGHAAEIMMLRDALETMSQRQAADRTR